MAKRGIGIAVFSIDQEATSIDRPEVRWKTIPRGRFAGSQMTGNPRPVGKSCRFAESSRAPQARISVSGTFRPCRVVFRHFNCIAELVF